MFEQKSKSLPPVLPKHIGIIMDGNGRWATKRGLPRTAGHKQGAKTFGDITAYVRDLGIPYITAYAFSTENWKRPKDEVDAIMNLLREYLKDAYRFEKENVRVHFLGDPAPLDRDLQEMMADITEKSRNNTGITVNIALNYGGRAEIVEAARRLVQDVRSGLLREEDITEEALSARLYTAGQPDPDLIIRPSGEHRSSNFLLWQLAYAEFIYMDVLWPDFKPEHLDKALWEYAARNRRFGGI